MATTKGTQNGGYNMASILKLSIALPNIRNATVKIKNCAPKLGNVQYDGFKMAANGNFKFLKWSQIKLLVSYNYRPLGNLVEYGAQVNSFICRIQNGVK